MLDDKKLFEDIIKIQSYSDNKTGHTKQKAMINFILSTIKGINGLKIEEINDNILVTKDKVFGDKLNLPCFCAHIDTVHEIVKDYQVECFQDKDNKLVYTSKTGIGGDDKCGIFIVLSMLLDENTTKPFKACFFINEEIGCLGSEDVIKNDIGFFDNVSCLIGIDRKGNNDCINNFYGQGTTSQDFEDVLNPILDTYKYKYNEGFITDVFTLNEIYAVSAINLSCGYYKPHTHDEYIIYEEVLICLDLCFDILGSVDNTIKYDLPLSFYNDYKEQEYYPEYNSDTDICIFCKGHVYEGVDTDNGFVCIDCVCDIVNEKLNR